MERFTEIVGTQQFVAPAITAQKVQIVATPTYGIMCVSGGSLKVAVNSYGLELPAGSGGGLLGPGSLAGGMQ